MRIEKKMKFNKEKFKTKNEKKIQKGIFKTMDVKWMADGKMLIEKNEQTEKTREISNEKLKKLKKHKRDL